MSSNSLEQKTGQDLAGAHPEVEFALVLARTIQSIQDNPEQLRGAVYELARQKLREQFADQGPAEINRMTKALEVAIQGVEAHSKKEEGQRLTALPPPYPTPALSVTRSGSRDAELLTPAIDRPARGEPAFHVYSDDSRRRPRLGTLGRFALIVVIVLAAAAAVRFSRFNPMQSNSAPAETGPQPSAVRTEPPAAAPEVRPPPGPAPLLPTTYGIYAISAGKLHELEALPFRAPDIRVAVSAQIATPSRTVLPDGHVRFIVFRRDAAGSVPDQVDVRVVARIEQAMTFNTAGKPVLSKAEDNWVIRNISTPYRTAPVKDSPEMYEVQSKEPDGELTPGRYVLVIKGQAFDFTVDGTVTDSRQCLGRVEASNGTFYSACQKLP